MGDNIKSIAICVGGFVIMFLFLYIFTNPDNIQLNAPAHTKNNDSSGSGYTIEPITQNEIVEPVVSEIENEVENSEESEEEDNKSELFLMALQYSSYEALGDNCEVYLSSNNFVVNIWYEGLSEEIIAARLAQGETPDSWIRNKQATQEANIQWYQEMLRNGLQDHHMVFNIASDVNHDVSILQVIDGVIEYDFLETDSLEPLYIDRSNL